METTTPKANNVPTSETALLTRTEVVGEEIIRRRAYERYVGRGKQDGHALNDWLQSEQEVIGVIYGTNV